MQQHTDTWIWALAGAGVFILGFTGGWITALRAADPIIVYEIHDATRANRLRAAASPDPPRNRRRDPPGASSSERPNQRASGPPAGRTRKKRTDVMSAIVLHRHEVADLVQAAVDIGHTPAEWAA